VTPLDVIKCNIQVRDCVCVRRPQLAAAGNVAFFDRLTSKFLCSSRFCLGLKVRVRIFPFY
jgi:hypothetical protein